MSTYKVIILPVLKFIFIYRVHTSQQSFRKMSANFEPHLKNLILSKRNLKNQIN